VLFRSQLFGESAGYISSNAILPGNREVVDPFPNIHRRKMLRRAANRKSAQLSRARKKAHMEDMKTENARLQRLVDILESQSEILFCVNKEGKITYIPEKSIFAFKEISSDPNEDDPVHVNQLLTLESVQNLMDAIAQVNSSENIYSDSNFSSSVREVNFLQFSGLPSKGFLRCSKVSKNSNCDDGNNEAFPFHTSESHDAVPGATQAEECQLKHKKNGKKQNPKDLRSQEDMDCSRSQMALDFLVNAAASLGNPSYNYYQDNNNNNESGAPPSVAAGTGRSRGRSDSISSCSNNGSDNEDSAAVNEQNKSNKTTQKKAKKNKSSNNNLTAPSSNTGTTSAFDSINDTDEYVCVIRPAEFSLPSGVTCIPHRQKDKVSLLSRESVAAHEKGLLLSSMSTSESCFDESHNNSNSSSSGSRKNTTSSESSNSESGENPNSSDNGENESSSSSN